VTPVAREVLPRLVSGAYGGFGNAKGGGEYRNVKSSWDNADASINYLTQSYAVNSFDAFKARSIEEAGTEFCRAFVSVNVPTNFESILEPDSPPQFHAWFSSSTYSDVTVPATAQYKVFYHIFAGDNQGSAFRVYLKDPPAGSFFNVPGSIDVASGFVGQGQFATETRDFTAPEGYKQLCVNVNGKEECGFKEVTTSFALNYLSDKVVGNEITRTDITSAEECISGSVSPAALLNPNIQAGAEEALSPEIYNRGIVRVCATSNPGAGTDPSRFVEVGNCGNNNLICWVDKKSAESAISASNKGVLNETLSKLEQEEVEFLVERGEIYGVDEANQKIRNLNEQHGRINNIEDARNLIKNTDLVLDKLYFNHHKAMTLLLAAKARKLIVEKLLESREPEVRRAALELEEDEIVRSDDLNDSEIEEKVNQNNYSVSGGSIFYGGGDTELIIERVGDEIRINYVISGNSRIVGNVDGQAKIRMRETLPVEMDADAKNHLLYLNGRDFAELEQGLICGGLSDLGQVESCN